jgi:predicted DCC family thiol-disulfide oxidoreductase YuxK
MNQDHRSPVVFFDGECGLCNRFVQFLLAFDKQHVFKVAPLQGITAKRTLPERLRENLTSLVVVTSEGSVLTKSRAVMAVLGGIGGIWRLLQIIGSWLPPAILDSVYDAVAARRYRWFGKLDTCRLPTSEEREYFLD